MVSLFHDVNTEEERLEFSGSSAEDIACAKLFWQTVCLLPHLESDLVSSDVSQRRRSAPIPGSCGTTKCSQYESSPGMSDEYLAKVAAARYQDQQERLERLSQLRCDDLKRFSDRRLHRQRLEQKIHSSRFVKVLPPIENSAAARQSMALIEEFERQMTQDQHRPDTA